MTEFRPAIEFQKLQANYLSVLHTLLFIAFLLTNFRKSAQNILPFSRLKVENFRNFSCLWRRDRPVYRFWSIPSFLVGPPNKSTPDHKRPKSELIVCFHCCSKLWLTSTLQWRKRHIQFDKVSFMAKTTMKTQHLFLCRENFGKKN